MKTSFLAATAHGPNRTAALCTLITPDESPLSYPYTLPTT